MLHRFLGRLLCLVGLHDWDETLAVPEIRIHQFPYGTAYGCCRRCLDIRIRTIWFKF